MLRIEGLSVRYSNRVQALRNVNLALRSGRIHGIMGPSGGGKSSLLKGILGLVPRSGEVTFRGRPIGSIAKKTAYVEQTDKLDRDFPISVFQCALLGSYPGLGLFRRPGAKERAAARQALKDVHMWALRDRPIGELSGGQFQRVLIARALVQDAELILLDEPFVGIDVANEAALVDQLKRMAATGKTILVVHHDLSKAPDYFDDLILVNGRVIAAGPTPFVFTQENLAKTFRHLSPALEVAEAVA